MSERIPAPRRLSAGGAERKGERAAADLLARLPELDADRLARERVWREVVETLPVPGQSRGRRWVPILAATATAFALVFVLRLGLTGGEPARLELAAGSVLAAAPEHDWVPALAGTSLPEATRLRTNDHSRAVVALSRSAVLVDPETDLGLESLRGQTFLRVSGGEVVAEVEHRKSGESFVVQTTRYRVTVKGTIFSVRERAADDVTVSVSRGLVQVTGEGGSWDVPAGHSWSSKQPETQGLDEISAAERSLLERASVEGARAPILVQGDGLEVSESGLDLGPAPVSWNAPLGHYHFVGKAAAGQAEADATANAGSSATVTLAVGAALPEAPKEPALPEVPKAVVPKADPCVGTACAPAPVDLLDQALGQANRRPGRTSDLSPGRGVGESRHGKRRRVAREELASDEASAPKASPAEAAAPPPTASPAPAAEPQLLARLDRPVAPEPAMEPFPTAATAPTPAAPPPVVMALDPYSQAVALSRSGHYEAAAQALDAIARGHGLHADLALYDLARLRQRHLGDPAGALAALVSYEKLYPRGSLAQEVELSAIELELGRTDLVGALAQMDRFLDEHPDSERAPEVHLLRGNVLRRRGDCKGALREYRHARSDGTGAEDDDGLYFTAYCQQKLGQQDAAAESLQEYLKRFPSGRHLTEVNSALQGR